MTFLLLYKRINVIVEKIYNVLINYKNSITLSFMEEKHATITSNYLFLLCLYLYLKIKISDLDQK